MQLNMAPSFIYKKTWIINQNVHLIHFSNFLSSSNNLSFYI